jgi:predicted DNA-binding ArsR family transcriptional regulator
VQRLIAIHQLFEKIARDAVSGLAITHEDLADLLSLKDNADDEIEDYVEAIQVCRVIPRVSKETARLPIHR